MSSSMTEEELSSSMLALMNIENDVTEQQQQQQQQQTQDDVVASRVFHSEGLKDFLDNLKELDHTLIIQEEAKEAADKARAKREKKYATVRFVKTIFGISGNKSHKRPAQDDPQHQPFIEPLNEKIDEIQQPVVKEHVIHPSPYFTPLKYRLQPRKEQANLTPSSMNALTRSNPDAPVSAITIARNRGEAALALFGSQNISADNSVVTSLREPSLPTRATRRRRSSDVESIDISQPLSINIDAVLAYNREEMSSSPSYEPDELKRHSQQVFRYQKQDLEYVIIQMAQNSSHYAAWRQYMESYSQGHFNLINPPPPPPLSSSFEYLPSVFPPGEAERMRLSRQYDILWPQWGQDKAGDLIRLAMKKFKTRFVSLSFFNEESEVFKAENGFNQSRVDRSISLAAHCLLSKDVLVILDTKEDWRFTNNPLVTTRPHIRFWAGAPMMSTSGEVLGVFAIFSAKPRVLFTPVQRRELAEFTSLVMKDLKLQVDALANLHQRSTPILDRDSLINAPYEAQSIKSVVRSNVIESDLVPSALTYQKDKTPKAMQSCLFLNRTSQEALLQHSEQTPPSSAESSSGYFETPTSLKNQRESVCDQFGMTAGQSFQESLSSYPTGFRVSSPRPFSSSDLTSLHPHPPNTPIHSVREADLSIQPKFDLDWNDFKELTDEDCAEPIRQSSSVVPRTVRRMNSGRFTGTPNMKPRFNHLESIASLTDYEQESGMNNSDKSEYHCDQRDLVCGVSRPLGREEAENSNTPAYRYSEGKYADTSSPKLLNVPHTQAAADIVSLRIDSSPLIDLSIPDIEDNSHQQMEKSIGIYNSPSTRVKRMPSTLTAYTSECVYSLSDECLEEAAYACAFHAQSMGYDLIYAVEIKPARQFMSEQELLGPNGLHKRILVAYGLTTPLDLASDMHIRVLRGRGGEHWNDDLADTRHGDANYQTGLLIPILSEGGPKRLRSSGIVMGAFRKPGSMANGYVHSPAADMERLVDFADQLKDIFQKKERKQHRSNTEAPFSAAYPANEAQEVELKTHSFDVPRSRRY
ncbi:hypothetical protein ONS95_011297 [Cadophora gregata]|uniref:uncharacterized protein n=1 Tax=Cadophora gregata TaxID=51156 RepID=UPI0026DD9396|nr:uncharacterized protein ONS95_011297 [Cadophora gregata]KAK0119867.1 hypothetical protein ONS95_011297 [Cadophora gregata]KAK0120902.1 hypothetical protein ONS96_011100 [Cadophora gregata f. sp. sojae]